jgi:hypothetical protein
VLTLAVMDIHPEDCSNVFTLVEYCGAPCILVSDILLDRTQTISSVILAAKTGLSSLASLVELAS